MLLINKQKYKETSDKDLLDKYKQSHNKVFIEEIFNRYAHLIYGVCIKYSNTNRVCKDVLISIMEILMKQAKSKEIKNLKSWLYVVTKNECFRHNKEMAKIQSNSIDQCNKDIYYQQKEEELNEVSDKELLNAIEELIDEQKQCLKLFYFEQKSYKQIAEQTGFEIKKVKSYIQNAKRNLKIILSVKIKENELV